jgi:hypothetical protein
MSSLALRSLALNGIHASTGEPLLSGLTPARIAALACGEALPGGERQELRRWLTYLREDHLDTRFQVDLRNLAEAGWGVIFPEGRADELRTALASLLAWRRSQAESLGKDRYRELVYRRGETKSRFLARHGVSPGPADPDLLPYYLLIAGSPEEIPFNFQYQLDVQYGVGRIAFATLAEYACYAESVVRTEQGQVPVARRASFFGVAHPEDPATAASAAGLVTPLADRLSRRWKDWEVEAVVGEGTTKSALAERMGGERTPALLFTAGHGLGFNPDDERQLARQGALICQDWPGPQARGPIHPDHYLSGADIGDTAAPAGLVAFLFACYSGGTPASDSFEEGDRPERIAAESFVARLPQRLLGHPRGGALAVVGHVDRAWIYSFQWPQSKDHLQVFESALGRLFDGYPIGAAMEYFNQHYAELSTDLAEEREAARWEGQPDVLNLANLWTASRDARSYAVLGDPAVRLAPVAGA